MKILITGFQPFGGDVVNPAWEAVKALPERLDDVKIIKAEIPVVFGEAFEAVRRAILMNTCPGQGGELPCDQQCEKLAAVICVGQAGGRSGITPEKIAINFNDAAIPDNAGNEPENELIRPDGPDGYFSTLPVTAMVDAMRKTGIPANLSLSAGAYVCNNVFYELMDYLAAGKLIGDDHISAEGGSGSALGGFIHVPFSAEQLAGRERGDKESGSQPGAGSKPAGSLSEDSRALPPSLSLAEITRGLEICIGEIIKVLRQQAAPRSTIQTGLTASDESLTGQLYKY
ncbi:MAG: pyroglutamyl-peptidase I [Firmicutes bacterium]|nr:pyroglutamyl-peptidase I [Bacillota bacterium]